MDYDEYLQVYVFGKNEYEVDENNKDSKIIFTIKKIDKKYMEENKNDV